MSGFITGFLVLNTLWVFVACNQGGVSGQTQSESVNVQSYTVEELKQELFNAACDEDMKKSFEEQIEVQQDILTDQELKNSLRNMKEEIRC